MRKLYLLLLIASTLWAQDTTTNFEEELLLFGDDDLLLEEDPVPAPLPKSDTNSIESPTTDSSQVAKTDSTADTTAVAQDTTPTTPTINPQPAPTTPVVITPPTLILDNATINIEHSVDIDKNAAEYRSPQKALFLSLAVPGLGQAYAKRYWKTGLYGAIEVGAIVGAVVMSKKSKRLYAEADDYRAEHFNTEDLRTFYKKLYAWGESHQWYKDPYDTINSVDEELLFGAYRDSTVTVIDTIIGDDTTYVDSIIYGYDRYVDEVAHKNNIRTMAGDEISAVHGWSDMLGSYNTDESSYAGNIEDDPTDFTSYFYYESAFNMDPEVAKGNALYKLDNYDTTHYETATFLYLVDIGVGARSYSKITGYSSQQQTYISMLDDAERANKGKNAFIIGLVINHIVSAADAMLTARKYNRELLREQKIDNGEEPEEPTKAQKALRRISIDNDLYYSASGGVSTKVGLVWRF